MLSKYNKTRCLVISLNKYKAIDVDHSTTQSQLAAELGPAQPQLVESIRHPYKIGDQVNTQTNCSKPRNPSIICLGNNQWKIPACKDKTTLKMHSCQFFSQNSDQVGGKAFIN